jgi:hypothetical protein
MNNRMKWFVVDAGVEDDPYHGVEDDPYHR